MKTSDPVGNAGYSKINVVFVIGAVVVGFVLIWLSSNFEDIAGPRQWLTDWTAWAAKYVALIVAARSVIKLVDATAVRLRGG